jgi:FdhD protein
MVTRARIVAVVGDGDGDGAVSMTRTPDVVAVEEPMTIRLDDHVVSTTMRTPGNDFELAVGFCFTEGLLVDAPVDGVRYCATGSAMQTEFNTVSVSTGGRAPTPTPRLGTTSSSCGWCGGEMLEHMCERLAPHAEVAPVDVEVLLGVGDAVREHQQLFERTGAVHAAASFDADGSIRLVREDIGRHNAVDKVIGAMVLAGELPAVGLGLFVSGRASVEMVQKAWSAGFATLVAVSAPTALAVDTARRAGLVLAGFTRDGVINVYSPERPTPA